MFVVIIGMAVKQTSDGECEERTYVNGKLEGQATIIFPDSSKGILIYKDIIIAMLY